MTDDDYKKELMKRVNEHDNTFVDQTWTKLDDIVYNRGWNDAIEDVRNLLKFKSSEWLTINPKILAEDLLNLKKENGYE